MKNYKQLTTEQRYQIEALLQVGLTQTKIAVQLSVPRSTICRELKRSIALRGRTSGTYVAANADRKTKYRHKHKFKKVLLTPELKKKIADKMVWDKWSPAYLQEMETTGHTSRKP